jgi:hypothetical protein
MIVIKMSKGFLSILLVLFALVTVTPVKFVLAAGPRVVVTQVDMSNYPEVVVYVSVTDDRGQPLSGLGQTDFQVTEDGTQVALTDFAGTGDVRTAD